MRAIGDSFAIRRLLRAQLVPAAAGICLALALGAGGFGLGVGYAVVASPAVAPVPAAPGTLLAMASVSPPGAVGGPEDEPAAMGDVAAAPLQPVNIPAVMQIPPPDGPPGLARPVASGWVSSGYGRRMDPFSRQPALHRGMDFAGQRDTAILAAAPGVVSWAGPRRGYGNLIEIDHGNGWITRYGHNAANLVESGDYVKPGQQIALMGATGRATGTHLHFEVLYRGRHQNPARFVARAT